MKATKYLGAVYRSELAAELRALGYELRHGRAGPFELAHVERARFLAELPEVLGPMGEPI